MTHYLMSTVQNPKISSLLSYKIIKPIKDRILNWNYMGFFNGGKPQKQK